MRKKIEKSDTRLPNTFRQTEPDIRAYTVDDIQHILKVSRTTVYGKPLIQTQTLKREKLKLSLNSKAVHSSFLMLRQLRICLKNTAPCTE